MVSNRIGRKTAPGFADPNAPAASPRGQAEAQPAAQKEVHKEARGSAEFGQRAAIDGVRSKTPLVEVEVTYDRGPAPRTETLRRVYEVWTNNHVYAIDARMVCVEVRKTTGGDKVSDHPFLGTRLVGGQAQDEKSVEMSYPLPRPGSFAVFEAKRNNRKHFSRTSAVTRVVLRLRIMSVTDRATVPTWEDVSGEP